jgi:hypothetical protein
MKLTFNLSKMHLRSFHVQITIKQRKILYLMILMVILEEMRDSFWFILLKIKNKILLTDWFNFILNDQKLLRKWEINLFEMIANLRWKNIIMNLLWIENMIN